MCTWPYVEVSSCTQKQPKGKCNAPFSCWVNVRVPQYSSTDHLTSQNPLTGFKAELLPKDLAYAIFQNTEVTKALIAHPDHSAIAVVQLRSDRPKMPYLWVCNEMQRQVNVLAAHLQAKEGSQVKCTKRCKICDGGKKLWLESCKPKVLDWQSNKSQLPAKCGAPGCRHPE